MDSFYFIFCNRLERTYLLPRLDSKQQTIDVDDFNWWHHIYRWYDTLLQGQKVQSLFLAFLCAVRSSITLDSHLPICLLEEKGGSFEPPLIIFNFFYWS